MPEQINLNVADQTSPAAPDWRIGMFSINTGYDFLPGDTVREDVTAGRVDVTLVSSNFLVRRIPLILGQEAITASRQLNKANLSTKSLEKRLLELVLAFDPRYAGVISGTPD